MPQRAKKTIFLDLEGTFTSDVPYPMDPSRMELAPGAASGLPLLHASGYQIIVASNQPGVARNYFPEIALAAVENRARSLFEAAGAQLAGFFYCPHDRDGHHPQYAFACSCQKPAPGLLQRAAGERLVELGASWLIGNLLDDVQAGHIAGAHAVLIDDGAEDAWDARGARRPDAIAVDFAEAAVIIASWARGGIHA